jgi:hypothetical protein
MFWGFFKVVLLEVPFSRDLCGFLGRVFPGLLLGGLIEDLFFAGFCPSGYLKYPDILDC